MKKMTSAQMRAVDGGAIFIGPTRIVQYGIRFICRYF